MRKLRPPGFVRVAFSNECPYRDGRLRRAHLIGPLHVASCLCHGLCNERSYEESFANENVFASRAEDPEGCRMFARSWNGLWYLIDGKTGRFHDVVVPDTATAHRYAASDFLVFTPSAALFWGVALFVLFALSLLGLHTFPVCFLLLGFLIGTFLIVAMVAMERARATVGDAPSTAWVSVRWKYPSDFRMV